MTTLDTRELAARLAELEERDESECDDCFGCIRSINGQRVTLPTDCRPEPLDDGEIAELDALRELRSEVGDEFEHGAELVPDDEFEEHARELADSLGLLERDYSWPHSCIDWQRAAEELRHDYSTVTYDGTDYLVRL